MNEARGWHTHTNTHALYYYIQHEGVRIIRIIDAPAIHVEHKTSRQCENHRHVSAAHVSTDHNSCCLSHLCDQVSFLPGGPEGGAALPPLCILPAVLNWSKFMHIMMWSLLIFPIVIVDQLMQLLVQRVGSLCRYQAGGSSE